MGKMAPTSKESTPSKQSPRVQKAARSSSLSVQNNPKVTKTTTKDASPGASKPHHKSTTGLFSKDAPSQHLRFPKYGNLTAVEVCTFLPNWLRSSDLLCRLFQNGLNTDVLVRIINHHRKSSKEHGLMNNSLLAVFTKAMVKDAGHKGWTVTKMIKGEYLQEDEVWDAENLSLAAMQFQCRRFPNTDGDGAVPIDDVEFKSLAVDVKAYPDEATGDAHELTACVRYAVEHPDENLQFPRDFQKLAQQLGQKPLRSAHFDREVLSRWKRAPKPVASSAAPSKATTPAIPSKAAISPATPFKAASKAQTPTTARDIGAGKDSAKNKHFANARGFGKGKGLAKDVDSSFLKAKKSKTSKKVKSEQQEPAAGRTLLDEPPYCGGDALMAPLSRGYFIIPADPDFDFNSDTEEAFQPQERQSYQQLGCSYSQDHHNLLDATEYVAPDLVPVAVHDLQQSGYPQLPSSSAAIGSGPYYRHGQNSSQALPVAQLGLALLEHQQPVGNHSGASHGSIPITLLDPAMFVPIVPVVPLVRFVPWCIETEPTRKFKAPVADMIGNRRTPCWHRRPLRAT